MSRQLLILGETPDTDVPRTFIAPYKGVPQFDLEQLDRDVGGPAAYAAGTVLAPARGKPPAIAIPVGIQRYCPGASDGVVPYIRAVGAPLDFKVDDKMPPISARFPRADPSR